MRWLYLTVFGLVLLYGFSTQGHWGNADERILAHVTLRHDLVLAGHEPWRLLTAHLFHVDLRHLFYNILGFLIFGHLLARDVPARFLGVWLLVAAVWSTLGSLYFGVPDSVGFSGVVYGLEAAFIVLALRKQRHAEHTSVGQTLRTALGYALLLVVVNLMEASRVNLYGHLGGAFGGILCALAYPVSAAVGPPPRWAFWLAGLLALQSIAVLGVFLAVTAP